MFVFSTHPPHGYMTKLVNIYIYIYIYIYINLINDKPNKYLFP
jgi:hypothetical protein